MIGSDLAGLGSVEPELAGSGGGRNVSSTTTLWGACTDSNTNPKSVPDE